MKSAKVITIGSEKGGIGKSSLIFNIAWYLADKGKKILIMDLDAQEANITRFCNVKGFKDTIYDALKEKVELKDIIKPVKKNLDIVPANEDIQDISERLGPRTMQNITNTIKDNYDFIFVDISPSPSHIHTLALSISDYVLIPMILDVASIDAIHGFNKSIEIIKDSPINPNLQILGIVLNKYNQRSNLSKQVVLQAEKIAKRLNTKLFKSTIRDTVNLAETIALHKGITETNPKSNGAKDIEALAKEIVKEVK